MRQGEKLKVCFILPEVARDTATHFLHKKEMMEALKDYVDFMVIQPTFAGIAKIKLAYFFQGYRIFYVHYSLKGALVAIVLTKLFGGTVYYWNCGLPWLYKRGLLEEKLFRFILRHTVFVTGTEGLAAEYAMRYGIENQIRVVPNTIEVSRFHGVSKEDARKDLGIAPDKKVVLFLHRLSKRKGADLLPNIIQKFADRNDILFLIVGDGPEKSYLVSRISYLRLEGIVRMAGAIPNYKASSYMAAADIYLMPSEEEGMPNALLEAMAAGVPFVASDVGGVKEMTPVVLHEFVLPYGKTHEFVEAIKKLLADEELRERISTEEKGWVKRYDVSVVAKKFLELLQE